jgi:acyl-CoA dehydrogenase
MLRTVYGDDHEAYRKTLRDFIESEVVPVYADWYSSGMVPREFYYRLGALGVFGIEVAEEYGGAGIDSYKFQAVLSEETNRAAVSFGASGAHVTLCLPYLQAYATEEQKKRWLPGFVSGEIMFAIAMTEPGTGSDLAGMRTTAKLTEDGKHYLLNGAKTFITGGVQADRMIVAARTAPPRDDDRRYGLSLLVVDTTLPGYSVGRKLDKIGLKVSDTAELTFTDVAVPVQDLLGDEHCGFSYLGNNLPRERLGIAVNAYAQAKAAVQFATQYTQDRTVFSQPVASFQNTKFELAACQAEVDASEAVIDRALNAIDDGQLSAADAASAKLFCTEVASRVIDRCLQLHGGYGYITEYPVARLFADSRVNRIYGGTSEVMKLIIAKNMGL